MDNTPIYIKMADCPEIQGLKPTNISELGVVVYATTSPLKVCPECSTHLETEYCPDDGKKGIKSGAAKTVLFRMRCGDDDIWLPRQDDLQKMVTDTIDCPSHSSCAILINVGHRIHQWCDEAWDYWMQFTSMEQLWLAFVMKEKHNKTWNGEAWIDG